MISSVDEDFYIEKEIAYYKNFFCNLHLPEFV